MFLRGCPRNSPKFVTEIVIVGVPEIRPEIRRLFWISGYNPMPVVAKVLIC